MLVIHMLVSKFEVMHRPLYCTATREDRTYVINVSKVKAFENNSCPHHLKLLVFRNTNTHLVSS
jgi:hypothetical protein